MRKQVVHTANDPPGADAPVPGHQGWRLDLRVRPTRARSRHGQARPGRHRGRDGQVCENLKAVLEAGGSSREKVVKVTSALWAGARIEIEAIATV